MIRKPMLGIILEYGFHDIKTYIHSGFATKLAEYFDIVWFAIDKGSPEFYNYFRNTGFPVVYFRNNDFHEQNSKTEARNQSVRRHWMISKNLGAFHNYSIVRSKTFKSLIIGTNLLKKIYENRTLREIRVGYVSTLLEDTFRKNRIDHLLGAGYASAFSKYAFVTANNLGIKTWYLVNSWKDLFINNFVPFDFLAGIFVWSEQMKNDYLYHMPYLRPERIQISGNPTFDALKTSEPFHPRSYYSVKYGISEKADWLLYTMMPPGIVNDEIETTILVANELLKKYSPEEKVIILRRNPNHSGSDFKNRELPANMILGQHYCTYDKGKDIIVQSHEGEQEWIDLLHHSALNLSVPSTVTLEFLTLNKPVINIGFGPDGMPDERLRQHFEAGFYKKMFLIENVIKVLTITEINKAILGAMFFKIDSTSEYLVDEPASDKILHVLLTKNGDLSR
jgi:hypothetical protein